jgi:hypothetical protein
MPPLQIDFEDGLRNDTVVVSAAGHELWHGDDVTTNLSSNVAAIAHVDVPEDAEVEIEVPTQGLSAAGRVHTRYLIVRIESGRLTLLPSDEVPLHA